MASNKSNKVPEKGTEDWKKYIKEINTNYKERKKEKERAKYVIINELHSEPITNFDQLWDIIYKQVLSEWEVVSEDYPVDDYTT